MKTKLAYMPVAALLWVMSKLPLRVLYLLADFIAWLARSVVKYRRRIVRLNIAASFPELMADEHIKIEKKFYRHLADYFVETVKLPSMSEKELRKRMTFENVALIDATLASGRDIVIYTSHFGNWEWITSMGLWSKESRKAKFSHVYRPLKNAWFDRYFLGLRTRFNVSIPMASVLRRLLMWRKEGTRWCTGFLSDQKPSHSGKTVDVEFMHRLTPFIAGTEELAVKLNAVVMCFDTSVVKRGYYTSTIRLITDDPKSLPEGEITRRYVSNLQEQIKRCPPAYLWSHNRWRLPKKEK